MASSRCPTCNQPFDPEQTTAMPFCSDRCRRIDLNRWLTEEISMPLDSELTDEGPGKKNADSED
jgi:endogenous inhibitor of DNA gyrase (YacG/DUF329 family)